MSVIQGSAFSDDDEVDTGDIGHSLRFRSSASAYLSRTFGTPTSQTRASISVWYKPGWLLGGLTNANFLATSNPSTSGMIIAGTGAYGSTYENRLMLRNGGATKDYWNLVFRDPTSWYHIVLSFDTTQGTQADRAKCWVNGVEQTKGASSLGASEAIGFLAAGTQTINGNLASYYGDYYASRFCLLDGQCVQQSTAAVSDFGYFNTEINEWVSRSQSSVKAVVDAGGTNSFMLDFDDATSLTTLGYDKSSKGNNWTLNNFSLTAGTTYDWTLDVPGNSYATLNPIYPSAANITNGNLSSGTTAARGTLNSTVIDSQWFVTAGASAVTAGVIDDSGTTSTTSVTANKVFAFKMTTAGALSYKNVTDAGSWTSIATGLTGNRWPYSVTQAASWNFGQQPLPEALDTGFLALCQRNLPDPAINNPEMHFDVVTRTGTGASYTKTGLLFGPELVWPKSRSNAYDNHLFDIIRGANKVLYSNLTSAEVTQTQSLMSFNADGYTLGTSSDSAININGAIFVDWLWKMGGAPVANNAGSIPSQVSANVLAGQSVVTYTGNVTAGATFGHGLTQAPELHINFRRGPAGANHFCYHSKLNGGVNPGNYYVLLNGTGAQTADSLVWNNTAPNSTVVTLGSTGEVNANTYTFVSFLAHSVPGYSKVGSYIGNGSADGPYVECGFKPKYVLVKSSTAADDWRIYDATRPGYNVIGGDLRANTSGAEATAAEIDFTSNGFKLRVTTTPNAAQTYIFYAIADVAGKYSLGR